MKKFLSIITIFMVSMFFSSCGSSSNSTSVVEKEVEKVEVIPLYQAIGSVVDGPIYNAKVDIVDINDSSLIYASTTTDENGRYSVPVENLPLVYRVLVYDGQDSGVDGEINSNDEPQPFTMSAIVHRDDNNESNNSVGHVSPATTMVDSIVEDGALPFEEATELVNDSFGLEKGTDLSKEDALKNDVVNKLNNLIALLTKAIPSTNKKVVFKSIVKTVIKKKIKIKVTNTGMDIKDLNLTDIATTARGLSPDDISLEDIEKLGKVEIVIKTKITKTIKTIRVISTITPEQQKEAVAAKSALEELLKEIQNRELDELNIDELTHLVDNLEVGIRAVLDGTDLNTSGPDDIDFIGLMVRENLAEDPLNYKDNLVKAMKDYKVVTKKTTSIKVKKVIKYVYKNTSLDNLDNILKSLNNDNILDELLRTLSGDIGENSETEDILSDMFASRLAKNIDDNNGSIEPKNITENANETILNPILVETVETRVKIKIKIKIKAHSKKLTHREKSEVIAVKKIIYDIKINIKIRTFTEVSKTATEDLFDEVSNSLEDGYAQGNMDALLDQIRALELLIVDLSEVFNPVEYKETIKTTIKIVETIRLDTTIDPVVTLAKIKIVIKTKIIVYGETGLITISEDEAKKSKEKLVLPKPVSIKLPQPTLKSMPKEFQTPLELKI